MFFLRRLLVYGFCGGLLLAVSSMAKPKSLDKPIKNEQCEYDLDLIANSIRVVCRGENAKVNIFATNAQVNSANFEPGVQKAPPKKAPKLQRDDIPQTEMDIHNVGPITETVINATKKMDKLKRKLTKHTMAMANITALLTQGDLGLRSDLDAIRRMRPNTITLKDAMLAAIRNQYNFMRTAILTQNAELSKMMDSLQSLIDVTSRGLQSAAKSETDLVEQISFVNQTMLTVRRMMSRELKRKRNHRPEDKQEGSCLRDIAAIGSLDALEVKVKKGTLMKDPSDDSGAVYVIDGIGASDRLFEYHSEIDLEYELVSRTYDLPYHCQGTGHVVYKSSLYCQKEGTRKIMKYKISWMERVGSATLENAGIENTYPYTSGENTDIDLAVDELGLWAVYATRDSAGKMIVSKLDDENMEIEKTWMTSYPKDKVSNTFMVCGVLYAVVWTESSTYINYMFDTNTMEDKVLKEGRLVIPQPESEWVMLDYNPQERRLYGWRNKKVDIYQVFPKKRYRE